MASASRQRPSSASSAGRDAPRVAAGDVSQLGSRRSSMASITSAITASTSGGGGGGQTPRTSLAGRHSLGGSPHGGPGTPSGGSPYVHIPYRNSMLTSVLRDSLGGNCATALISTLNPEPEFIDESISTCRFAVRCGQLANDVTVNESRDAAVSLVLLRQENAKLASQLAVEMRARQAAEARLATVSTPTAFLSLDDSSVSRASVGLASEAAAVGAVAAATAATASPAFRVDAGSHTGSVTVRLPPLDRRLVIEHAAATCVSYAIAPELVEEEEQEELRIEGDAVRGG
ncbi:hypothetical protein EON62_04165 [archaeon]|nr:MAG: hypothetical protein EON62_04165 [archaeon]